MGNTHSTSDDARPSPIRRASTPQPLRHKPSRGKPPSVSHAVVHPFSKPPTPLPPTASLVPSASSASTSTSTAHAHATVAAAHSPTHARTRSITTSAAPTLRAPEGGASHKAEVPPNMMGHAEWRQGPPPAAAGLEDEKQALSPASRPVDVPHAHDGLHERETFEPSSGGPLAESPYSPPASTRYDRPPRLPLPIEEEVHTPGSPILPPQDLGSPLDHADVDGAVPRRTSMLSSTTMDEEDDGDTDVFAPDQSAAPTVSTTITWHGQAERVYVTGTFVSWERKFKLHMDKELGCFAATLQLKPGTHHIKFLVDGNMVTSDDLPTTVDYTNILVNYIEVVAPLPATAAPEQPPAPAQPMPIPGATGRADTTPDAREPVADDVGPVAHASEAAADPPSTLHETVAPDIPQPAPIPTPQQPPQPPPTSHTAPSQPEPQPAPHKQKLPRPQYTNVIPQFFLDQDIANPDDERYQRATRVIQHLPQPPSLPMFLGKSILNAATPHKDDTSVLTMPNHTVLNHLATSSIKDGVLATSGTTRYKKKFLTTIMHKPTSDDG